MSNLSPSNMLLFESLFKSSRGHGYVLDFSDSTFKKFVSKETGINVYDDKYNTNGTSKANRLREFILLELDVTVSKLLLSLVDYAENINLINSNSDPQTELISKCRCIANKLSVKKFETESDLIEYKFQGLPINKLSIDRSLTDVILQRIKEIEICFNHNAPLACVLLCGSTLEGILLGIASSQIQNFNQSPSSPKDKEKKVKDLNQWTLNDLINVSHSIGLINENVKSYSHDLRNFRNYIHPKCQMDKEFNPDTHTAALSVQVLLLAINQLTNTKY